jgi:uncharacterized membrane protein
MTATTRPSRTSVTEVPAHVARNVETIGSLHLREERRVGRHQRAIETLTAAAGQPGVLYVLVAVVLAWALGNGVVPHFGLRPWDPPPFFWMQGTIALCALLMTTMVLITQNRLGRLAERRSHLDLQVNLLAEQKITKLIALLEELRRDLPSVHNRRDVEAAAMAASADPRAVVRALDDALTETTAALASAALGVDAPISMVAEAPDGEHANE